MATTSRQSQREVRKPTRIFDEVVDIPDTDDEGSDEEEESSRDELLQPVAGQQIEDSASEDEDEDDEEGEMWETESFLRDVIGDSSTPVIFEPRR